MRAGGLVERVPAADAHRERARPDPAEQVTRRLRRRPLRLTRLLRREALAPEGSSWVFLAAATCYLTVLLIALVAMLVVVAALA